MTQQNPGFRTVMRGYEPSEVDRAVAELRKLVEQARSQSADSLVAETKLHSQVAQLEEQASSYRTRIAALEQEQREVVRSFLRRPGGSDRQDAEARRGRGRRTPLQGEG